MSVARARECVCVCVQRYLEDGEKVNGLCADKLKVVDLCDALNASETRGLSAGPCEQELVCAGELLGRGRGCRGLWLGEEHHSDRHDDCEEARYVLVQHLPAD